METSMFIEYIKKFFSAVVQGVVNKINGSENPLTYLHKTMLRKEFSVSGKWESMSYNGTTVSADYVAMDSALPLKKRDSFGKASGDIPKMGIRKTLNEQQLTDLDTMVATNVPETDIAAKLFDDTAKVIGGINEKNEAAFLIGLSTGVTLVDDDKNVGTGIRLDYKYPTENKFGVPVLWSNTASTPLADINSRILAKASTDGKRVIKIMLDRATFNNIAKTDEAKDLYAMSIGNFGDTKPVPNLAKLNQAVQDEFGYVFEIVDRSVIYEKNGVQTSYKPWAAGAVAALTTNVVGALTWARLAEMNHPVEGVTYETADDYILVSKYRTNNPSLTEATAAQARVVPVIGETVYLMDSLTVQA